MVKLKKNKGITLIALIITIIVLLILAGITIATLTGDNGLLNKISASKEENRKQTAKEKINLKITEAQISAYAKNQEMPTLQYLADFLRSDNEIEYVDTEHREVSVVEGHLDIGNSTKIFTKLEEYPYEFEINSDLRLASIDGVKIATAETQEIEELNARIQELERQVLALTDEKDNYKALAEGRIDTSDATATENEVLSPYTAYVDGNKITGNISNKSNQTITASTIEKSGTNGLITIPANGYYSTSSKLSIPISTLNAQIGNSITSLARGNKTSSISCSVGDYFIIQTIYGIDSNSIRGGTVIATCTGPILSGIDSMGALVRATSTTISSNNQFGYIKIGIQ